MRACFIAFALGVALVTWCSVAFARRAVLLVRHADRLNESEHSPLSSAGKARAQRLAGLLKGASITTIYTTPAKSSGLLIKTAQLLALGLNIAPVSDLNTDREDFFKLIRDENRNGIILVVGTAGSVPALLKLFGHPAEITIAPTEYDNLFVLVPKDSGPTMVLKLRY